MVGRCFGDGTIQLVISADTADYNIYTAAGSPAGAANVTLTIAAGVVVYQNAGSAAIRTGSFAGTATVTIVNAGTICGKGGTGGAGGANGASGSNGSAGGPAIYRDAGVLKINNTSGYIFGGGGGGGGGSGSLAHLNQGGGGGGGGRGRVSSSGGSGGAASAPGSAGTGGDYTAAGGGGAAGGASAGAGGDGADWGDAGEDGSSGGYSVGVGGGGGNAVSLNGGSVTWLGGYNSSQVRGQIS